MIFLEYVHVYINGLTELWVKKMSSFLAFICRFLRFRNALDAEMREANKKENLLGAHTAESLLHTMYFYNGKLFGLRANEHI